MSPTSVAYQQAVVRALLPFDFELETAGPTPASPPSVALLLDTLAKEIFWISLIPLHGQDDH